MTQPLRVLVCNGTQGPPSPRPRRDHGLPPLSTAHEVVAKAASGADKAVAAYVTSGADEAVTAHVASRADETVPAYVADEAVAEADTVVTTAVAMKTTMMTIF